MIETIVAGLIIAAVSALAWVAYNHAEDYRKASPKFLLLSVWVTTLISTWMFASLYVEQEVSKGLRHKGENEAATLVGDILEGTYVDISTASLSLLAWLAFLLILEFWVTGLKKAQSETPNG